MWCCSLWPENSLFSSILAANHQLLIDPVAERFASKWCCPCVLSRCLSLCTVNTVSDSWLHLKLWGHYILTGSLFTLRLPPISCTPPCYLCPTLSVHQSLSGYNSSSGCIYKEILWKTHSHGAVSGLLNLQNALQMNMSGEGKERSTPSFPGVQYHSFNVC